MKYSVAFILALSLCGCSEDPTPAEFDDATHWCDQHGGMKSISFGRMQGLRVRCKNSILIINDKST
jgi:hypothetical protein